MKNTPLFTLIISLIVAGTSCKQDDPITPAPLPPTVVKQWTIDVAAKNENPAPAARNETGTAVLELLSDNSLKYTINITNLTAGDALVAAHLHVGNVVLNGPIVVEINPVFTGGNASGIVANLRQTLVDSLKDDVNNIYFNAHSTQVPSGLVRGQLNAKLEMVADVDMNSANEVPAGTSVATGKALLRLTTDKILYVKLTISGLEAGDVLNAAHIHKAGSGINGPVILGFYANAADFGTVKTFTLTDPLYTSIKTDAIYLNAHSTNKPGGIIRGQIR